MKLRDHFRHGEPLQICQCHLIISSQDGRYLAAMLSGICNVVFRNQGGIVKQKKDAKVDTEPILGLMS